MDLGLASLTDAQLYELLQETLLAISGRCTQAYMLQACQDLISSQGKLLTVAKKEFYAQVEAEQTRQVQETKSKTIEQFRTWIKEQTVIPIEVKKQIIDEEFDRLLNGEIKRQVLAIREFVRLEFPKMMQPGDHVSEAEELIIATDAARQLVRERREAQEAKAAVEATKKSQRKSGSAYTQLMELARLIGNPRPLRMVLNTSKINGEWMVLDVSIYDDGSGYTVAYIDFAHHQFGEGMSLYRAVGWQVKSPGHEIYQAICKYILECADTNKTTETIPVYRKQHPDDNPLTCRNCGYPWQDHHRKDLLQLIGICSKFAFYKNPDPNTDTDDDDDFPF